MRTLRGATIRARMLSGVAMLATAAIICPAHAAVPTRQFDLAAQAAEQGIPAFAKQAGVQIVANGMAVRGKRTNAVRGHHSVGDGLRLLLAGTGLVANGESQGGVITIVAAAATGAGSLPAQPKVSDQASVQPGDDIIVTAQKREESIQSVPIAVTALSNRALDDRKIEGGSELLRAVPNVTFSKSNFSMYNFSIRGIGTKAVSASSDPAVAVSFNNTPLVRNRLFEAEFFDVERIEVLRGPQGTLYGRNATAGVVNMIPRLPGADVAADLKLEAGNYGSMRAQGMVNLPLGDTLGIRVAGAWTSREGFDYNTFTKRDVNGRNLWSTRATLAWEPSENFRANFIWQHFEEDDNRSRTGKQLCTRDPGPESIGNVAVTNLDVRGRMSQGCLPRSLYEDEAFGTPNGRSLAYMIAANSFVYLGLQPGTFNFISAVKTTDPFAGVVQSRNLREISTSYDPVFRAKNDVFQLNLKFSNNNGLEFHSQTAYSTDKYFSTQDYNRVVSNPAFNDSLAPMSDFFGAFTGTLIDTARYPGPTPGGILCDPQIGCSDRLMSVDLNTSNNRQWYQEFRVQSDFKGSINFNVGVNYLDFETEDKYYVFNNVFTLLAQRLYGTDVTTPPPLFGPTNLKFCPPGFEKTECVYTETNGINDLQDVGHNYFLSKNRVRTKSLAFYSEVYVDIQPNLKLTTGLRYTRDWKISSQIPSQLLLGGGAETPVFNRGGATGGKVNSGYPALDNITQSWDALTGRAVLDWKPDIKFSDDTLVYLSYARGYKGGGTNPPRVDLNPQVVQYLPLDATFKPEYLNAFEIGTKNSFANGRLTLNATAFFYDYKDYQVSQIIDRISYNENFDAISYGLELEAAWRPSRSFSLDANLGYLKTRLKEGSRSIDVMDRTLGNPDWVLLRPWLQAPSNCIAPRTFVEKILRFNPNDVNVLALSALCAGSTRFGNFNPAFPGQTAFDQQYGFTWDPLAPYNPATVGLNIAQGGSGAPNGGRGFSKDISGNELPNAPRWTANIGAQYTFFMGAQEDWQLTLRGDYYRQAESFARVYNTAYDRLRSWDNFNLTATLARPASNLTFQLYVKNVFNSTPITDFFTNSDDTGLTTNVFTVDPRIIAFSIRKAF